MKLKRYLLKVYLPRVPNHLGFESSQRTIDDIRTIVIGKNKLLVKDNQESNQDGWLLW